MTAFLIVTLLIAFAVGWLILRDQIQAVESRLRWSAKQDWTALEQQIATLAGRVRILEKQLERAEVTPVPVAQKAELEPVAVALPPASARAPERGKYAAEIVATTPAPEAAPLPDSPAISSAPPECATAPLRPGWSDRLHRLLGASEWEALIAGSVLNKLGALILVIGIALFLGYSFSRLNPAGRAGSAALISAGILAGGVVLERRNAYRVFSRGLIGAGWAALYTTAYAMYALPAAQVISNPFAGSILLLGVSAGMIAHSLRYHTQAITAVAYFGAFAALSVTPSTRFAVISLTPLSASLLYFAWRFKWHTMALLGLFATYGTCFSRVNANASLWVITSILITYWLLFESFDILRAHRGLQSNGLTWIFPLNAIAFLTLMYRAWVTYAPQAMWQIAAISAFLFFASALIRVRLRPSSIGTIREDSFECIRRGTYEAPLAIAAILAGLAILGRVTGFWTNAALAFEAELFYLAGVRFRSSFLRQLGGIGFCASLADALSTASRQAGSVLILGVSLHSWTPSVLLHVCLFYLNRAISRTAGVFSFAATGLAALIISCELTPRIVPLALFLFALALLEFALRKRSADFRLQSYLVALAAVLFEFRIGELVPHAPASIWGSLLTSAAACWLFTIRMLSVRGDESLAKEAAAVRDLFAAAGSLFVLLTLWILLPGPLVAASWACLAVAWLAIGASLNLSSFRWLAAIILSIAYARLLGINLASGWAAQNVAEQWLVPLFLIGILYYVWHWFRRLADRRQQSFAPVFTWLAALAAVRVFGIGVDQLYLVSAWGMLFVALLIAGLRLHVSAFRWQSYCIAALATITCVLINFNQSGSPHAFARVSGVALLTASFFAVEFLLPRDPNLLGTHERLARSLASLAAMLLLTGLLYHEVSGGLLTVAWGLEALASLGIGFPARERILRLQGLGVFALCILKLFLYDLRNLESAYRILSFIALGAILLGVSLIYTRFRTQIQRYL